MICEIEDWVLVLVEVLLCELDGRARGHAGLGCKWRCYFARVMAGC